MCRVCVLLFVCCLAGCASAVEISDRDMNNAFKQASYMTYEQARSELVSDLNSAFNFTDSKLARFVSLDNMVVTLEHYNGEYYTMRFDLCGTEFRARPMGFSGDITWYYLVRGRRGLYFKLPQEKALRMYAIIEKLCGN